MPSRRSLIAFVLAGVVAVQGFATVLLSVLGPLHTHRGDVAASAVLVDFRRVPVGGDSFAPPIAHVHGAGLPERHLHAIDDASVVVAGGDRVTLAAGLLSSAFGDDGGAAFALAALVAIVADAFGVALLRLVHSRPLGLVGLARTPALARLDRPPA